MIRAEPNMAAGTRQLWLISARLSRKIRVTGSVGNGLTQPKMVNIAALIPAQQAVSRNMTGPETPAGDAARPLPALDAPNKGAAAYVSPSKRIGRCRSVPKGCEATAMDRQPNPGPARKRSSRFDGANGSASARSWMQALRPDDGRSASKLTPLKVGYDEDNSTRD